MGHIGTKIGLTNISFQYILLRHANQGRFILFLVHLEFKTQNLLKLITKSPQICPFRVFLAHSIPHLTPRLQLILVLYRASVFNYCDFVKTYYTSGRV